MRKIYTLGLGLLLSASAAFGQYCVVGVGPTNAGDTDVEAVALVGETMNIAYTGCPGVTGVIDQTGQVADVIAGNGYTADITWGTCGGSFGNDGEAWIDFDGSQTFEPGESIGSISWAGGTGNLQSYAFTVPVLALNGTHRMRVMMEEGGTLPLDPCASFAWGTVVDFSISISGGSSCGGATALNTSNPTSTTIDLNWTPDGGSIGDNVEWGFPGFTPGTGAEEGSAAGVVGGTTNATGLLPGTTYEFYVETDCGGTQAAWAGPFTFTTAGSCGFFTVSLFDTFGDGWNGGTVDVYINGALFQAGLTVAAGNGPVDYQIPVNIGDIVSLDYTASGFPGENEITVLDQTATVVAQEGLAGATPNDIGDFTIPTGLEACPSCPVPTTLMISNVTASTVDFAWVESGTATDWIIEYGPSGFTPGTGTDLVTTNNPETVTGLSATTTYDFYVRAICGVGDTSSYAGSATATTPLAALVCGSGNAFALYSNDFESGAFPTDWTTVATGDPDWTYDNVGGTGSADTGPSGAHSGTGFVYLETSGGALGDADTMTAGPFDLSDVVDAARVTFYYHMYGGDIGTMTLETSNDGINWVSAWSQTGQVQTDELDPWNPQEVDVTTFAGGDLYLRFIGSKGTGGSGFAGDMAIDLLEIEGCVNCPGPSNLVASNITESSVELNWTVAGVATEWEIEYGPVGFTLGTGTSMVTTNNPETITGLTELTDYDFYVRAICGVGDSSGWVGPTAATTLLSPLNCVVAPTLLINEDFEGGFPAGWSQTATADPDWTWDGVGGTGSADTGPSGAFSGTGFMYLETSGGAAGDSDTLSVPSVNLYSVVGEARATWKYHMYGDDMGKMAFQVSTDGVLWNEIWSDSGQLQMDELDPWATAVADLAPYAGGPLQMRFIGIGNGTFNGDMAIDTFVVEACITCPEPSAVVASNATTTTVDLAWTVGGAETAWNIEYGPAGFTPGTGTIVPTTNNPETVTGLDDNTEYDFYVYADCGAGDTSNPAGPGIDTTLIVCPAPTGVTITYSGQDSLALTWTPGGLESMWNVEYGPLGYTPGTGTGHVATNVPDTTFNIPNGVWEFYVQADCGGGVNNPWAGPILFISPILNDSTCDAITVPVDGSTSTYANVNATEQVGTPVAGFNTIWFEFVAPASGHVEVRTCGTDFDNMLEVYEATDCADFGTFTYVVGATGNPFTSCNGVDPAGANICGLTPGNTYYMVIGGETATDEGIFDLQLTELPAVDAGTAMPIDVCEDDTNVDLFTAITGNLTTNGTWYNPVVGVGNEFPSSFSVVGNPAGTYPFFYVDTEICGEDTVETSITVVETPNVGMGSTINAGCNFGFVNLYDGLSGTVDFGGIWYDDSSNALPGGDVNFAGEPAGTYTYHYVVDNGVCAPDTATVLVDVIDCTSIGEDELSFKVYPNPVKDVLTVQLDRIDENTTVQILDIKGQVVTAPTAVFTTSATIDVSDLADGVYFVRVTSGEAIKEVRVIKQ